MKNLIRTTLAVAVLLSSSGLASAQPFQDEQHRQEQHPEQRHEEQRPSERHYQSVEEHNGWRRGQPMRHEDWDHAQRFDYHEYGLREPPRGYEWRQVNGVFVLGAIATGLVLDMMLNAR